MVCAQRVTNIQLQWNNIFFTESGMEVIQTIKTLDKTDS